MSFLVGLYLLGALVGPAAAFVPIAAGAIMGGTVMRTVVGGVAVRVGLPLAESVAAKISAANVLGVIGTGMIVMCGNNYLNGNDCSGQPLAKLRPSGHTGDDSETVGVPVAATSSTYAATYGTQYRYCSSSADTLCTGWYVSASDACAQTIPLYTAVFGAGETWLTGPVFDGPGGAGCKRQNSNTSWFPPSSSGNGLRTQTGYSCPSGGTLSGSTCTTYTCPSGYTLSGTTCNPPSGAWASDGTKSFRAGASGWTADPKDPDSTGETLANPLTQTVVQPNGQPAKVTITANPDGSITTQTWAEKTSPSGTTQTVYNSYTLNSGGSVTTATTNIYEGNISTVVTNTPAPNPQMELPTDYARENTVAQIKPEVTKAVDELKKINTDGVKVKEDGTPASEALDPAKTAYNDAAKARQDAIADVTSPTGKNTSWTFSLSLPTGCSPLNVDMRVGSIGRIVTLDPCAYQATIHELVSMLWAGATLFMVVGMFGRTLREV